MSTPGDTSLIEQCPVEIHEMFLSNLDLDTLLLLRSQRHKLGELGLVLANSQAEYHKLKLLDTQPSKVSSAQTPLSRDEIMDLSRAMYQQQKLGAPCKHMFSVETELNGIWECRNGWLAWFMPAQRMLRIRNLNTGGGCQMRMRTHIDQILITDRTIFLRIAGMIVSAPLNDILLPPQSDPLQPLQSMRTGQLEEAMAGFRGQLFTIGKWMLNGTLTRSIITYDTVGRTFDFAVDISQLGIKSVGMLAGPNGLVGMRLFVVDFVRHVVEMEIFEVTDELKLRRIAWVSNLKIQTQLAWTVKVRPAGNEDEVLVHDWLVELGETTQVGSESLRAIKTTVLENGEVVWKGRHYQQSEHGGEVVVMPSNDKNVTAWLPLAKYSGKILFGRQQSQRVVTKMFVDDYFIVQYNEPRDGESELVVLTFDNTIGVNASRNLVVQKGRKRWSVQV
ncbi:hypothetical protein MRB53_039766 [Persea americana]|nr:hypothetical protein MRB53_039766 [Persea americana]